MEVKPDIAKLTIKNFSLEDLFLNYNIVTNKDIENYSLSECFKLESVSEKNIGINFKKLKYKWLIRNKF